MIFDAIVLAGGRSSRLAGTAKAGLVVAGHTLLESTLAATAGARRRVVVGDVGPQPADILVTRETPAFAGPASAIAAGRGALDSDQANTAHFTLVLACDMPAVADAVVTLVRAAEDLDASTENSAVLTADTVTRDGIVAVDGEGRRQYLVGLYRTNALRAAIDVSAARLENLAVKNLLGSLRLQEIHVVDGATDDIDTWADAARFGIRPGATPGVGTIRPETRGSNAN